MPSWCSRAAVAGPTPQSASTGSGCRNASSRSGGTSSSPSGFATPLATLARNFVRAIPTVSGRPTSSSTRRRSRAAISSGVPAMPPHPAHVEERLVDRQPLDERRRVLEDAVDGLARLRVRVHARPDDDRAWGRGGAPRGRPSPSGCRTPSPRSWRRARPRRRRSPGGRAAAGRRAARPRRRTRRDPRAGSSPSRA